MAVARAGHLAVPEISPPPGLRPFLRFTRLPPRALAAARRAVDDHEEFRARVREAVSQDEVGRAAWVWLDRPEGWRAELARLLREADDAQQAATEAREERSARRKLERAEDATRRAEAAAAAGQRELDEARAALAEERRGRRVAESDTGRLRQRLRAGEDEWRAARESAEGAERQRAEAVEDARRARDAARALHEQVASVTAERDALAARLAGGPAAEPPASAPPLFDRDALAAALSQAAAALQGLAAAVGTAADVVRGPVPGAVSEPPPSPAVAPPPRQRRRPAALPPAVFDDSVEAADHLVRLPQVVLLVDGYNVSKLAWPHCDLGDQRLRLVGALAELAARTGCEPHVVFDGAPGDGAAARTGASRSTVRVTFSPPGVEADDVLIAWAARLPAHRPVVVASNDRRVQDGVRRSGANVVGAEQLLAVLRR